MNTTKTSNNLLKLQKSILDQLKTLDYPDASRIAREIVDLLWTQDCKTEPTQNTLTSIIKRLKNNEPWEYIRGWCEFCEHKFIVNSNVLIPRIETEQLVNILYSQIVHYFKAHPPKKDLTILEVGTGSGCIILSLEQKLRQTITTYTDSIHLAATDISKPALAIANCNARNFSSKVTFFHSDLLENVPGQLWIDRPTIVVANLPYISEHTYPALDPSVTQYEPSKALIGGAGGWELYEKLLAQIREKKQIDKSVAVLFEIAPEIAQKVTQLARKHKYDTEIINDCYNQKRFIAGTRTNKI